MTSQLSNTSTESDSEQLRTMQVARKDVVAEGVVVVDLVDPNGAELPTWEPGAHLDLILPGDVVRQYSLCSSPTDQSMWQVGVLREAEGRGGSIFIHDKLEVGDSIEVRGPRNNFPLEDSEHYIFVAGGIGVTPMLPMIAAAEAKGVSWELLYGGRTRASMSFVEVLEQTYGDRVSIRPQDVDGLLDLNAVLGQSRDGAAIYCCGPEPLLQAVEGVCQGWPDGALHIERFSPKEFEEPVRSESFEVELSLSDMVLTVPQDKSILEVMEEGGVPVVASCLEGTCGSCETVVLEGTPEHRDSILTPAEQEANETMMVCVSRAISARLVLEI